MELPGERDRGEARGRDDETPPLQGKEYRREEERDQPEQVPRRLSHPVRHQAEHDAAEERRGAGDAERPQPRAGSPAGEHEGQEDDQVVRPDVPGRGAERPVRDPEQPSLQARRRLRLRAERVRVGERGSPLTELVPDEPERPAELEVVARGRLAVPRRGPCQVVRAVGVADRGPRRPEGAHGVEREGDEDEARTGGHVARPYPARPPAAPAADQPAQYQPARPACRETAPRYPGRRESPSTS